jgi:hypothetical protein
MGVAVLAGCLAQPAFAQNSQPTTPTPYGAARVPEPLPIGACPTPPPQNLVPGPLTPDKAPQGPGDCLSLPPSTPGAFQCENYPQEVAIFFDIGGQALMRQNLGKGAIAIADVQNTTPTIKVGTVPSPLSPPIQSFNDVGPEYAWGARATVGILAGTDIIELTGFFDPNKSVTTTAADPGRIFAYFINAPSAFAGTNGLFRQADMISTTLQSQVGDAEINYRYSDIGVNGLELIIGVRYFDVFERLGTTVDQNGLTAPLNPILNISNPVDVATYTVGTHNRIIAPQLGFEGNWGCQNVSCLSWLSLGFVAKGAWGGNCVSDTHSLVRGDGIVGFETEKSSVIFSQMYEIDGFMEIHLTERCKVRAGYNAIWALHVDSVVQNYDFDLTQSQQQGRSNHDGSVLYHGPMVELQLLF